MVRCRSIFLLDGGGSFFSDVCDCQGDKLYAADDDGQQQGIDDQQDQPYCVEYTGYKCVFCHVFWPPFPHNMVFLSSGIVQQFRQIFFLCRTGTFVGQEALSSKVPAVFEVLLLF